MDREAGLLDSIRLEADPPGFCASLTGWFGLITLEIREMDQPTEGESAELLTLTRRILHVWHPALGYGMA